MNNRALDKVRRKNTAFKKYLNSREDQDYSEYCKERNKARKATRQAVKDFEKLLAKEAKRNPKAFHKYVNSKTKVRSGISELETNDGLAISDQEKSEALNTFFTSVFTKEDLTEIPTCVTHQVNPALNKRPIGLIAPPFKINFLATETWPKMKLKSVRILQKIIHLASGCHIWSFFAQNHMLTKSKSRSIASQITNLASRKSYLVIILPNSYQK